MILFLLILNLLNTKQVLQEIVIILLLVMMVMMQIKEPKMKLIFFGPLKHLSNFWRALGIPLINCEINLILTWSKSSVLADMTVGNAIVGTTELEFKIEYTKLYVSVVTLSIENDKKLLEQLKSRWERTADQKYNTDQNYYSG